jgi:hypothetical protein
MVSKRKLKIAEAIVNGERTLGPSESYQKRMKKRAYQSVCHHAERLANKARKQAAHKAYEDVNREAWALKRSQKLAEQVAFFSSTQLAEAA